MTFDVVDNNISKFGTDILISIFPAHTKNIYSGIKRYELRKSLPKTIPKKVYLYETNGNQQISGHIIIERVISGSPQEVWDETGTKGTTKTRFFNYFKNANKAHAFEISHFVKYENPIKLDVLKEIEPGFRVPQNFLYLNNLPRINKYLTAVSSAESLLTTHEGLRLCKFNHDNEMLLIKLIQEHIGNSYLETGKAYAQKLIELNDIGHDFEGIFTNKKTILQAHYKNELIGFIVLTEKIGGSVKTGPFILFDEFCGMGLGTKIRKLLHQSLASQGHRKVYCTTPTKNIPTYKYLIQSGYRIEAHLKNHYHHEHGELVFGYMLSNQRGPSKVYLREIEPTNNFEYLKKNSYLVARFLEREFSTYFSDVSEEWAIRQIEQSRSPFSRKEASFKSRIIFVAGDSKITMACIAGIKRGGSVKLTLLSRTSHQRSIYNFIGHIEQTLLRSIKNKIRKVYTHIALGDTDMIQPFLESGYASEGVLERPYNDICDMIVLGKTYE